jgi:xanthine dehydrogenase accessory factor
LTGEPQSPSAGQRGRKIEDRQPGYHVTVAVPAADLAETPDADILIDGFGLGKLNPAKRFILISTQCKGDEAAPRTAVATEAVYDAFGWRRGARN